MISRRLSSLSVISLAVLLSGCLGSSDSQEDSSSSSTVELSGDEAVRPSLDSPAASSDELIAAIEVNLFTGEPVSAAEADCIAAGISADAPSLASRIVDDGIMTAEAANDDPPPPGVTAAELSASMAIPARCGRASLIDRLVVDFADEVDRPQAECAVDSLLADDSMFFTLMDDAAELMIPEPSDSDFTAAELDAADVLQSFDREYRVLSAFNFDPDAGVDLTELSDLPGITVIDADGDGFAESGEVARYEMDGVVAELVFGNAELAGTITSNGRVIGESADDTAAQAEIMMGLIALTEEIAAECGVSEEAVDYLLS